MTSGTVAAASPRRTLVPAKHRRRRGEGGVETTDIAQQSPRER